MISKITINNIASYKGETSLETDKKVNLIYGLNGSGKTILSNYLKNLNDADCQNFGNCSIEGFEESKQKILVYNQKFVEENFYQSETQKGIFTLAKENKEAKENIQKATKEVKELEQQLNNEETGLNLKKTKKDTEIRNNLTAAQNKVWEIKTTYTGGDRVFDNVRFLDGLKGKKQSLFNHLLNIALAEHTKTIDKIKTELQELGENAQKREALNEINLENFQKIETNTIFQEEIVGNENSTVAKLIKELQNSDWVKKGLNYVNLKKRENCPFCQEKTLTKELVGNIESYFDETYEKKIKELNGLKQEYKDFKNQLNFENYKKDFFTKEQNLEIENLLKSLSKILDDNLQKIQNKINQPSQNTELKSSEEAINNINSFIDEINKEIEEFNKKLDNKTKTIENLKKEFWEIQRKEYNQTITNYQTQDETLQVEKTTIENNINTTNENIEEQESIISDNQKKITNIEATIKAINKHLLDFGIQDFEIVKNDEQTYKIKRGHENGTKFRSLSEGEKTVISFLYFVELCKGLENQEETKEKIIVIDDPISSLSHMYVFNVGQMIKEVFTRGENDFKQIFILTHSLYFFNELVDKKDRQENENERKQKLFRITKTDKSIIEEMGFNEIQNEYESYWYIVRTGKKENKFLVANAMRNILEHFFGFIDKSDSINNIFQKRELKNIKYQSFNRYMNRESHSDRTNISDYKEFNLGIFTEAFEQVFEKTKYKQHYKLMMNQK